MFCFLSVHIFKLKYADDVEFWRHSLPDVLTCAEQNGAKKVTHRFLHFYEAGNNPVKLDEEMTEFYGELGVAHCMCDAKEPLKPGKNKQQQQNYFLKMTPALTKPGHCVLFRRVKCPYFHKYRLCPMRLNFVCCFLSLFLQVIKQKVVGLRFLMATWSVNICHFSVHDFSPNHSTRRHFRRSWEGWNCIARRE